MSEHYHRHFCTECGLCICGCRDCASLGMCACDDCPCWGSDDPLKAGQHECKCPSTMALMAAEGE